MSRPIRDFDEPYFQARHAHGFQGPSGIDVDLHWYLFPGNRIRGIDEEAWSRALPHTLRQTEVLIPDAGDHLLLLLSHGYRWSPFPPVRWVVDVVTLLRTEPGISWERVLSQTRVRGQTLLTFRMLRYLESRYRIGVPSDVLRELEATPVPRRERRALKIRERAPGILAGIEELRLLYGLHRQLREGFSPAHCVQFPAFVKKILGVYSLTHLARYVGSELTRRIFHRSTVRMDRPVKL
ncbi:MAG TPA: nucleotidyltransferase family protein [Nitrospira sp.]|nr:nucleotidyltransferase family protein [Nitrospira sp.]